MSDFEGWMVTMEGVLSWKIISNCHSKYCFQQKSSTDGKLWETFYCGARYSLGLIGSSDCLIVVAKEKLGNTLLGAQIKIREKR